MLNFKNLEIKTVKELEYMYTQEALFQFVFPFPIKLKSKYINPFRVDKNPSCHFNYLGNTFTFIDPSRKINYSWTNFAMQYLNIPSLHELCIYISNNFQNNGNYKQSIPKVETKKNNKLTKITINTKPYEKNNTFKFFDFEINESILKKANIFQVKDIFFNDESVYMNCNNTYAFLNINEKGNKNYQIYFPDKPKYDRYRSVDTKLIPQLENIDLQADYIIITKSNMDAFILKHILGFNAIAILNEGVLLSDEFMNKLNNRYKKIYLLFDNDVAGRNAVIRYKNHFKNIIFNVLFVPFKYGKDIKDIVYKYKVEDIRNIINKIIK